MFRLALDGDEIAFIDQIATSGTRAAIAAYLRAVEAQPIPDGLTVEHYVGASMRKGWAGNLAAEVEHNAREEVSK
jgi:hypothetical protein